MRRFAWQEGYAAFTVSASARTAVRSCTANQEEHQRKKTFREELVEMLEKAGSNMALMRVQLRPFQGRNLCPDAYRGVERLRPTTG